MGDWAHGSKPSRVNHTGQRTFTATKARPLASSPWRCLLPAARSAHSLASMPAARSSVLCALSLSVRSRSPSLSVRSRSLCTLALCAMSLSSPFTRSLRPSFGAHLVAEVAGGLRTQVCAECCFDFKLTDLKPSIPHVCIEGGGQLHSTVGMRRLALLALRGIVNGAVGRVGVELLQEKAVSAFHTPRECNAKGALCGATAACSNAILVGLGAKDKGIL